MTLSEYLQHHKISVRQFAARIPCEPATLHRILKGGRQPSSEMLGKIWTASNQSVTPNGVLRKPTGGHYDE
jgi:predicted transcriptional regulator